MVTILGEAKSFNISLLPKSGRRHRAVTALTARFLHSHLQQDTSAGGPFVYTIIASQHQASIPPMLLVSARRLKQSTGEKKEILDMVMEDVVK